MDTPFLILALAVLLAVFANLAATFGVDSRDGPERPETRLFS